MKATKLTFPAQFANDPIAEAKIGYDEIAKGVFQLWRYFSHARRGIVSTDTVRADAHGMVLTLDTWLVMSRKFQEQVLATAATLAQNDDEITIEDQRKVVFCAIQDLESTLAGSDETSFLRAMSAAATKDRLVGWVLPDIHRDAVGNKVERKPFPFKLDDVLPWWKQTAEMRRNRPD